MPTTTRYTVVLEPQPDGGFTVLVPALPEVVTEGDSEEEALEMAGEAIALALDHRRARGLPMPADAAPVIRKVVIAGTA